MPDVPEVDAEIDDEPDDDELAQMQPMPDAGDDEVTTDAGQ